MPGQQANTEQRVTAYREGFTVTKVTHPGVGTHRAEGDIAVPTKGMDPAGLDQIATELCRLLQEQIETVVGRKYNDLTEDELDAYARRKARILALRAELQKFVRPT